MILSVCIPTYNRSEKVKVTLIQLIKQIKENNLENYCEILVSESSDKKAELLKNSFKKKNKKVCKIYKTKRKIRFCI